MEINQRINLLIDKLGYNKSAFAAKIGVSQPIITYISTGRNNPGLEVIQKILSGFPEINPDWLILERGEMLVNYNLKKAIIKDLISTVYTHIDKAELEIAHLKESLKILNELLVEDKN